MSESQTPTDPQPQPADCWHAPVWGPWAGLLVLLLALGLYLATLDTGLRPDELSGGDLITHQYAQVQARPGNAPGYPLYTMGGWLWFRQTHALHLALNPVQRLASYSMLWGLLALAILYRLLLRLTGDNWVISSLLTLFYAVTYFFWYYSVTSEQYTAAIFQTLLIVWLAFGWEDALAPPADRDPAGAANGGDEGAPADRYLLALALATGACLANMLTTLFILPPLLWFVLSRQPSLLRRRRLWPALALAAALPVLSYAYVYLRGAAHPEWWGQGDWPSAGAWFLDFLTTRQGRDELAPGLTLARFVTGEFPALVWAELSLPVLAGALLGLLPRVSGVGRRRAAFLGGTLAIYLVFCWLYRFGNWFQVILPAYPLLLLALAALLQAVWQGGGRAAGWPRRVLPALVAGGLLLLVGWRFAGSLPRADQSWRAEDSGLAPGWALLADGPEVGSTLVGDYDEWLALSYLMDIWGARPAVSALAACPPPGAAVWDADAPVYVSRRAAAAAPDCLLSYHLSAAGGELIRLDKQPLQALPLTAQPVDLTLTPALRLVGYALSVMPVPSPAGPSRQQTRDRLSQDTEKGGGACSRQTTLWLISLYWQAQAPMAADYTVSVRPWRHGMPMLDVSGAPAIQDHQPVWGVYPTMLWESGELVRDDYVLELPVGPAPDGVQVLVYQSLAEGDFENVGQVMLDLVK